MQELSNERALPSRLLQAVHRLELPGKILQWASHRDGRSNHALADVYLLALDVEPGFIVLKLAGEDPRSLEAVEHERRALAHLRGHAGGTFVVPQIMDAPGLLPGELAMTYLHGGTMEQVSGTQFDPIPLATDLALALEALWSVPAFAPFESHPGAAQRGILSDVLDPQIAERLAAWEVGAAVRWAASPQRFLHGDLRPSNILIQPQGGTMRLVGCIDFVRATTGPCEEDWALLQHTARRVHPELPGLIRDALPPLDPLRAHDARVRLLAQFCSDCARARDWNDFDRRSAELERALMDAPAAPIA